MANVKVEPSEVTERKDDPPSTSVASDGDAIRKRIFALFSQFPKGVNDTALSAQLPDISVQERASAVNSLLADGQIDLFKSPKGLVYKIRDASSSRKAQVHSDGSTPSALVDAEERIVYQIIEASGTRGAWVRDIRIKSNLVQTQLAKVLKSLKTKKAIKEVKCVNSSRKVVYMCYDLTPDSSVTGGTWYSDHDFESEFVDVLIQQCYRFLESKRDAAYQRSMKKDDTATDFDPLLAVRKSTVSVEDVTKYISDLGIATVKLNHADIVTILDDLVYDGKVERVISTGHIDEDDDESVSGSKMYRAIFSPVQPISGLLMSPCGGCALIDKCQSRPMRVSVEQRRQTGSLAAVNPIDCPYMSIWIDSNKTL